MKTRRILALLLLITLIITLTGCESGNDKMMFEGSFVEIGESFHWFFDILTPSFFGAIRAAWDVETVVGFILALLMTIIMVIVYVVLLIAFFVIVPRC